MRHIYIRGILTLIWVAAAIVNIGEGGSNMTYIIMGVVFAYFTYAGWTKHKNRKGEK